MFKVHRQAGTWSYFRKVHHVRWKSYTSLDYCVNLVRSLDNENFLSTLLLPISYRSSAFAVRAFNAEVASVQDQVSQENLGLMRLKFWDECINKIYQGKVVNNPVAVELGKAVRRHKLSKACLKSLVSSRSGRIGQSSFASVQDMSDYADATCTAVFHLLLEIAGSKNSTTTIVADNLGRAQGLSNLLRGLIHNMNLRILNLPSNLLALHSVSEENIFRQECPEVLNEIVREVAENADMYLQDARSMKEEVPKELRVIFLPAVAIGSYLKFLKNTSYNVYDSRLYRRRPFLPILLYFNYILKSY